MRKRAAIEAACLRLTRSFTSIPPDAPSGRLHSSFLGLGVYARCPCADEDMSLRLRGAGLSDARSRKEEEGGGSLGNLARGSKLGTR